MEQLRQRRSTAPSGSGCRASTLERERARAKKIPRSGQPKQTEAELELRTCRRRRRRGVASPPTIVQPGAAPLRCFDQRDEHAVREARRALPPPRGDRGGVDDRRRGEAGGVVVKGPVVELARVRLLGMRVWLCRCHHRRGALAGLAHRRGKVVRARGRELVRKHAHPTRGRCNGGAARSAKPSHTCVLWASAASPSVPSARSLHAAGSLSIQPR